MSYQPLPPEERDEVLEEEYSNWFKDEFGFTPVITSSSGRPAVKFAQHVYHKFANKTDA